jgi:hypothetical protein
MRPVNQWLISAIKELASEQDWDEDSALYSIGMKAAFHGVSSLSPKQHYVFANKIEPLLRALDPGYETPEE